MENEKYLFNIKLYHTKYCIYEENINKETATIDE